MKKDKGRPIAIDPTAISTSRNHAAFLTPPANSPPYYGFPVLDDVIVDGFTFGKITDFEAEVCNEGDAFVMAPDGTRAGLVWQIAEQVRFREVLPPDSGRWGVWEVTFQFPMTSRENARRNLRAILPDLKARWEAWKKHRATGNRF